MTRPKSMITLLVFTSLGITSVESQYFEVYPKPTCLPCGGPVDFNCSTMSRVKDLHGRFVNGTGGQLWRIRSPNGNIIAELYSTTPTAGPLGYKFIPSSDEHVYTGLRVLDTNSTWNGTTFQCIAYTLANRCEQNDSAKRVTLQVGGPPSNIFCECQCPDVNQSSTAELDDTMPTSGSCSCGTNDPPSPMPTPSPTTSLSLSPILLQTPSPTSASTAGKGVVEGVIAVIAVIATSCFT